MTSTDETRSAVERFHDAVNRHDIEAVLAAITNDCHFESTLPPDGDHYDGAAAIGAFFRKLFDTAAERTFDVEELVAAGDRAVLRWRHRWTDTREPPDTCAASTCSGSATARSPRSCHT
jgi:ketosteroid isomerase-like protein